MRALAEGFLLFSGLALFFYRSMWAVPALAPLAPFYWKKKKEQARQKYAGTLNLQFKDALLCVSTNQKAGYSIENSFREAVKDMELLYGKDSAICRELQWICAGLGNNRVLESLLLEMARRDGVDNIEEFAQVFAIAKRSGGNITEMLERTAAVIEEKTEVEKEINILLSARRMEQRIMDLVPFLILAYISVTSKGFFDMLYHNPLGIAVMTACLLVYLAALALSERIIDIKV